MSNSWILVLNQFHVSIALSTAFHPKTVGQVEQINALLEDYLQHFVSSDQNDWSTWLPMAEFSCNNTSSSLTKFSSFFAVNRYHPCYNSFIASSGIPNADKCFERLQEIQQALKDNFIRVKESQMCFYNKDCCVDVRYEPGDLVWLSTNDIKTRGHNSKLDVQRLGPFRVRKMIGKNAAELELTPQFSCLHPVFDVS